MLDLVEIDLRLKVVDVGAGVPDDSEDLVRVPEILQECRFSTASIAADQHLHDMLVLPDTGRIDNLGNWRDYGLWLFRSVLNNY